MNLLPHLQTLIDHEIAAIQRDPDRALLPYRRLMMYDAFGPTFRSETYTERIQILQGGQLPLTRADRVRATVHPDRTTSASPLVYCAGDSADVLSRLVQGEAVQLLYEE